MDGLLEGVETGEPDGCTGPVFRIAGPLDAARIAAIATHARPVLVFGPGAIASDVAAVLDAVESGVAIVQTDDAQSFQELIDADRLFYLARGALSERDLRALIDGALDAAPRHADVLLRADHLRRLALAQSVAELAEAMRTSVAGAVTAAQTRCVLFDAERQVLWSPNESDGESTAVGLMSFVHRTGMTVCLPRAGSDPRFDLDLDGEPGDRILAVPVRANGTVLAVLAATRAAQQPPFEPVDVAALEAIAAHAQPYVAAWLGTQSDADSVFRHRALRELDHPIAGGPEPLQLDEHAWIRRASWLAAAALVAVVLAVLFAGVWR